MLANKHVLYLFLVLLQQHQSRRNTRDTQTTHPSTDDPVSYPSVVTPSEHSGYSNQGLDISNMNYPEPGGFNLPSYEEAVQAHNKHYGTNMSDQPPPYEVEEVDRVDIGDNVQSSRNTSLEAENMYDEIENSVITSSDNNMDTMGTTEVVTITRAVDATLIPQDVITPVENILNESSLPSTSCTSF